MIDLSPENLNLVKEILARYIPGYEVRAFGSRVTGKAKKYSDLDLVVMTKEPLTIRQRALLNDAFSESNLPIKVDVVDFATTSESFRKIILDSSELI